MKKKMLPKKIMTYFLLASLVMSAGGCSGSADDKNSGSREREERDMNSTKNDSGEEGKNKSEKDEVQVEEKNGILHPKATYSYVNAYKEGEEYVHIYEGYSVSASLTDQDAKDYPELQKVMEDYFEKKNKDAESQYREMISTAASDLGDGMSFFPYENKADLRVVRADEKVLSFNRIVELYSGGAHGIYYTDPVNFDVEDQKLIVLSDVFKDTSILPGIIMEKLNEEIEDASEMLWDNTEEIVADLVNGTNGYGEINFVLDKNGVNFYFEPYLIASYALGEIVIEIPYSYKESSESIFKKDFSSSINKGFIQFSEYDDVKTDLSGNGSMDTVSVHLNADEESGEFEDGLYESVSITINGTEYLIDEWIESFDTEYYLVHTEDNKDYLYLFTMGMDDYEIIYIYSLTDQGAKFVDSVQGGLVNPDSDTYDNDYNDQSNEHDMNVYAYKDTVELPTDPDCFYLGLKIDLLSTYHGVSAYRVGNDGIPVRTDDYYQVKYYGEPYKLTTKMSVPCKNVSEAGEIVEDGEIPAQTEVSILRTDGESFVDVKNIKSGEIYRLNITPDWPQMINGTEVEELFEGIVFAG